MLYGSDCTICVATCQQSGGRMKSYSVHEYPCKGAYSSSRIFYDLLNTVPACNERGGGIIAFPDDIKEIDISSFRGKFGIMHLPLSFIYTGIAGAVFSKEGLYLDVMEYSSGALMSLAMQYTREYERPVILKDFEERKLYSIRYNADKC